MVFNDFRTRQNGEHPLHLGTVPRDDLGHTGTNIAVVPLPEMFGYIGQLRSMTGGRASYTMEFSHYEPVPRQVAHEVIAEVAKTRAGLRSTSPEEGFLQRSFLFQGCDQRQKCVPIRQSPSLRRRNLTRRDGLEIRVGAKPCERDRSHGVTGFHTDIEMRPICLHGTLECAHILVPIHEPE